MACSSADLWSKKARRWSRADLSVVSEWERVGQTTDWGGFLADLAWCCLWKELKLSSVVGLYKLKLSEVVVE